MVHITSTSLCLSEDTKALKEYHDKFSQKMDDKENKRTSFTTSYDERLQKISTNNIVGKKLTQQHHNLKKQLKLNLINHSWQQKNLQLFQNETFSSHFIQIISHLIKISFVLWTTFFWSYQISTLQITWKIFTCITIHQKSIFRDPWRWHSPSN